MAFQNKGDGKKDRIINAYGVTVYLSHIIVEFKIRFWLPKSLNEQVEATRQYLISISQEECLSDFTFMKTATLHTFIIQGHETLQRTGICRCLHTASNAVYWPSTLVYIAPHIFFLYLLWVLL